MAVYRIGDVINNYREREGLTQAELAEGICEPEILSRIENGHHMPSRKIYLKLMVRMGQEGVRQRPVLITCDRENYQIKRELDRLVGIHEYEKAERVLKKLERKLDFAEPQNRQFLLRTKAIIRYRTGKITKEKRRELFEQAVSMTVKWYGEGGLEKGFYTHNEIVLLCNIATVYFEEGDKEKAVQMLTELRQYFVDSIVSDEERAQNELLVLNNLEQCYGLLGKYDECMAMIEEGIEKCLEYGKGARLCNFLYDKAYILDKRGENEEACKVILQALCTAKILGYTHKEKHIYHQFSAKISSQ